MHKFNTKFENKEVVILYYSTKDEKTDTSGTMKYVSLNSGATIIENEGKYAILINKDMHKNSRALLAHELGHIHANDLKDEFGADEYMKSRCSLKRIETEFSNLAARTILIALNHPEYKKQLMDAVKLLDVRLERLGN